MKKILFLLAALAYAGLGSAQSIEADIGICPDCREKS